MILVKGASQLEVENYANIETQKVAKWARNNKMIFNDQKSKVIIITKKKPKNRRDTNIFLNNKKLQQVDTLKYLGIAIDKRCSKDHIQRGNTPCFSIWASNMDRVPKKKHNAIKLKRVQRLINIKISEDISHHIP
jgi:hypothetical protein